MSFKIIMTFLRYPNVEIVAHINRWGKTAIKKMMVHMISTYGVCPQVVAVNQLMGC